MQFDDSDEEGDGDDTVEDEIKEEGSDADDEGGVDATYEETLKAGLVGQDVSSFSVKLLNNVSDKSCFNFSSSLSTES